MKGGPCYAAAMSAPFHSHVAPAPPLEWDGAVNARDLGGIGDGGRRVGAGRLYRMGRHEWVTEAGWDAAWADGVRTVIDLRNASELGRRHADPLVAPAALGRFRYLNLPTEDEFDHDFRALCGPYMSSPEHYRANLERWPERFAGIARAVVEAPEGGVVVHCAAGRDRTGLVTALLLGAVGVPKEAIAADYAVAVTAMNERYKNQEKPHEVPKTDEELHDYLQRAQGQLEDLLDTLDARLFLLDAGLSDAELAVLIERLTSAGPTAVDGP